MDCSAVSIMHTSLISSVCPKHCQSLINIWVVTFLPCSKHKCAQKMRPTCFSTSTGQECVPTRKEVVRQGQGDLVNFAMKFVSWADDSEVTGRGVRKVEWKGHERMQKPRGSTCSTHNSLGVNIKWTLYNNTLYNMFHTHIHTQINILMFSICAKLLIQAHWSIQDQSANLLIIRREKEKLKERRRTFK